MSTSCYVLLYFQYKLPRGGLIHSEEWMGDIRIWGGIEEVEREGENWGWNVK